MSEACDWEGLKTQGRVEAGKSGYLLTMQSASNIRAAYRGSDKCSGHGGDPSPKFVRLFFHMRREDGVGVIMIDRSGLVVLAS